MSEQNSKDIQHQLISSLMTKKKYRILSKDEKQAAMILLQKNYSAEQLGVAAEKFQTSVKNLRRWYC